MQPLVRPETTDTPRAVKSERSVPPPSTIRGWGRLGARGRELRSDDLERATVGATLSRGLGAATATPRCREPADGTSSSTPRSPTASSPSTRATGRCARRPGCRCSISTARLPASRLVRARHARHAVRHARRHGRLRRARQESPRDGTFGRTCARSSMRVADGRVVECGPTSSAELFLATDRRHGPHRAHPRGRVHDAAHPLAVDLAGVVRARPRHRRVHRRRSRNRRRSWPMTVGWIDCLTRGKHMGRGILMARALGHRSEAPSQFPSQPPRLTLPHRSARVAAQPLTHRALQLRPSTGSTSRAKRAASSHPESRSSTRSTRSRDWNRMYGGAASRSTSACCPTKPARRGASLPRAAHQARAARASSASSRTAAPRARPALVPDARHLGRARHRRCATTRRRWSTNSTSSRH
jgi:decaprenylphospho-beta-D-ribofuranose 2-oxidase